MQPEFRTVNLAERPEGAVRCCVVYNPLDVSDRAVFELVYEPAKPLSAYLDGLPDHVDWHCQVNDREAPRAGWALTVPKEGDCIVLIPRAHGGEGGGKQILAIVATLALAIVAPYLGAALAGAVGLGESAIAVSIATGLVSIAGGLLISALIPPPKTPNVGQSESDGNSFGIDGPKNSATEGLPVPVVYGLRRVGGNYINLYTENGTDHKGISIQHLYGQITLSEGEIESISAIEVNDQPATSLDDIEIEKAYGTQAQEPGEWFNRTVALVNIGSVVDTDWDTYTTSGPVDALRLDMVAPTGLMQIDEETGQRSEASVPIQVQWSPTGLGVWTDFRGMTYLDNSSKTVFDEPATGFRASAKITATVSSKTTVKGRLEYRRVGDPDWIPLEERSATLIPEKKKTSKGSKYVAVSATIGWAKTGLADEIYEFRVINTGGVGSVSMTNLDRYEESAVAISDKTRSQVRRSYFTHRLPKGVYDVRWKRDTPESESEYLLDALVVSDVGEIVMEEVQLIHTAWLGFKVLLSGQLNAIPRVTALVQGVKIHIFDDEGNIVDYRHSNNPADVALDVYLNERYGAGMDPDHIDFPAFAEWREFCDLYGFTCNMVFDYHTTIHEALDHVFSSGRAQRVSAGARVSVAIDRRDTPTMMFGVGNIAAGSLEITYMPLEDRINEVEVEFPDANDNFKTRSIRVPDEVALARGDQIRPTTLRMPAITSATRAYVEGWLRLQYNRLVMRSISFEAPVEAIACTVGDVIAVQHDMPRWDVGGRCAAGSTTTNVKLDRPAAMELGKDYAVMVIHDALKRYDVTITAQVGRSVFISDLPEEYAAFRRFKTAGGDWGVEKVYWSDGSTEILLEPGAEAESFIGAAELWDTDVIETRDVVFPPGQVDPVVEYQEADVVAAFSQAPSQYSNFMFGEKTLVGRLYRIMEMDTGSETGLHRIAAIEYHEEIYSTEPPVPENLEYSGGLATSHVVDLLIREEVDLTINLRRSKVVLDWTAPDDAYGGALISTKVNGGQWVDIGSVTDATTFEFEGNVGDTIEARVTAFSLTGASTPKQTAPVALITLVGFTGAPAAPTGFAVTAGAKSLTVTVNAHPAPDFKQFRIYRRTVDTMLDEGTDFVTSFIGTTFTMTNLDPTVTYHVWVQAENTSGIKSAAVGPVSKQPLSGVADTVNLEYSGSNDIPTSGTFEIMSFDVLGAVGSTQVMVSVTSTISVRRSFYAPDGVSYHQAKLELVREPYGGGTAVSLKSKTVSFNGPGNFSHTDTPGAGDWTYKVLVSETGSQTDLAPDGSSLNATGDVTAADLSATIES